MSQFGNDIYAAGDRITLDVGYRFYSINEVKKEYLLASPKKAGRAHTTTHPGTRDDRGVAKNVLHSMRSRHVFQKTSLSGKL